MRVDRESLSAKRAIHHDIGGLAPDARQFDERVAVGGEFAAEVANEDFAERDEILRLRVEQHERLYVLLQPLLAWVDPLLRRLHLVTRSAARLVGKEG